MQLVELDVSRNGVQPRGCLGWIVGLTERALSFWRLEASFLW